MTTAADLHTHSTASDGQHSPRELVRLAKGAGLAALALCDHDTVDGTQEAADAGRALGLRVLIGVELSAREYKNFHILGYGVDPSAPGLAALCRTLREGRDERKLRIIDFLRERGVELALSEVEELAGGDVIGRPHFAQVMVRRGFVSTAREAFDRYLDTEDFQRIERPKPEALTCVELIRAAGGRAALAHPYQLRLDDTALEALLRRLADGGLEGLECFYPRHTAAQTALYLRLAEKYGLHVTGGSDFHGERVKPEIRLTGYALDIDWLLEGEDRHGE